MINNYSKRIKHVMKHIKDWKTLIYWR